MLSPGPTFSIVIPAYNAGASIAKAIESCLRQTVLPNEIIIIDDASIDDTAFVIKSFGSDLIRYQKNDPNKGASYSRNQGMHLATADWILFLDADDTFSLNKIEVLQHCIADNSFMRAIGHAYYSSHLEQIKIQPQKPGICIPQKLNPFSVLLRNPVVTPALAVSKLNTILFDESMHYAEDHDFILRTAEQHGLWYIDNVLCTLGHMPMSGAGLSGSRWKMRKGEMRMYTAYCKRHNIILLLPVLLIFSLLKHLRNMIVLQSR